MPIPLAVAALLLALLAPARAEDLEGAKNQSGQRFLEIGGAGNPSGPAAEDAVEGTGTGGELRTEDGPQKGLRTQEPPGPGGKKRKEGDAMGRAVATGKGMVYGMVVGGVVGGIVGSIGGPAGTLGGAAGGAKLGAMAGAALGAVIGYALGGRKREEGTLERVVNDRQQALEDALRQ